MAELLRPQSIDEAADLIGKHGKALTIMGGGTSVLQHVHPSDAGYVLGVDRLGLNTVLQREDGWSVGAGVSLSALRAAVALPAVAAATREIGGPAIQNMATVGGNLFAREPYGDLAVALLAIGANLTFAGPDGETTQSIEDFYAAWSNGAPPRLGLLTRIDIAKPAGAVEYQKCARRRFASPSVVTVAAQVVKDGGTVSAARIALSGASAHPFRCAEAEAAVTGSSLDDAALTKAAEAAEASVSPKTDPIATDWYRRRMAGVFVRRVLGELA
jgi:CO/xanthine dehydrogenase FAD-binding subunit